MMVMCFILMIIDKTKMSLITGIFQRILNVLAFILISFTYKNELNN